MRRVCVIPQGKAWEWWDGRGVPTLLGAHSGVPLLRPKAALQGDQAGLWLPWGGVRPNSVGGEEVKIGSLKEGSLPRTLQKPESWSLLQAGRGGVQAAMAACSLQEA